MSSLITAMRMKRPPGALRSRIEGSPAGRSSAASSRNTAASSSRSAGKAASPGNSESAIRSRSCLASAFCDFESLFSPSPSAAMPALPFVTI